MASSVRNDEIIINIGPQHPSTHGVFRMVVTLDGETVVDLMPVLGYLHRGTEKLGEQHTYTQFIPYTDRMDYVCSMIGNHAYVTAVEKLGDIAVPERAEYLRIIMVELTRIISHVSAAGWFFNELGNMYTPMLYFMDEREKLLDLFEMTCGGRMTVNYMRIGGVSRDIPEEFVPICRRVMAGLPAVMDEVEGMITDNEIFVARTKGVGVLKPEVAIQHSVTGPMLRSTGVPFDLRRAAPYSIYDRFDFDVVTRTEGDCFARYKLRLDEARQSIRIVQQALDQLPEGPYQNYLSDPIRIPPGEVYHSIESPKGELGYFLVSDGSIKPYRIKVRAPSFVNLGVLPLLTRGAKLADAIAISGSIDIVMGEVDR
jgi:NADH-quinone oxidoreductase subunit D